jgi:epoxyqueuosine reductase
MGSPADNSMAVKAIARDMGFDLVGIARAQPSAYGEAYRRWIAEGRHGEMAYLARNLDERLDLTKKFPWAKSVVCVAMAYWQTSPTAPDTTEPAGKIARYAWGRDYHKVMEGKLKRFERAVRERLPEPMECRAYCDTGPILEREFAALAGLGWVGKNTLLIHPRHGSWFVLAEWITSLDLEPDSPIGTHCGTCTRCIDACPTDAITPHAVDATRCISYLTLEHRGTIAEDLHAPTREAGYLVGCDICQEVCPFNRAPLPVGAANQTDLTARPPAPSIALKDVLAWQEQEWDILTRGRAFRRSKFEMWKRNAEILRS